MKTVLSTVSMCESLLRTHDTCQKWKQSFNLREFKLNYFLLSIQLLKQKRFAASKLVFMCGIWKWLLQ